MLPNFLLIAQVRRPVNFFLSVKVTAWPTSYPFPVPITPVSKPSSSSRASVEEVAVSPVLSHLNVFVIFFCVFQIEDVVTTRCQGTPPAASLLPRPSLTMTASLASDEEIYKSNPIKSRIAAQFRNPVNPID